MRSRRRLSERAAGRLEGVTSRAGRLLRGGGMLESFGDDEPEINDAVEAALTRRLTAARRALRAQERALETTEAQAEVEIEAEATVDLDRAEARRLMRLAREGLDAVNSGAGDAALNEDTAIALESIISVTARPSLVVRDGSPQQIDLVADPGSEKWIVIIGQSLQRIVSPLRGVGAIVVEGETSLPHPAATVWRVGTDLVVTNAHVAEEVCIRNQSAPPGDATFGYRLRPNRNTFVDFALERGAAAAKVWTVAELVYLAGPDDVDAAVFRLAPRPDQGAPPAALAVGTNKDSVQQKVDVFAAGHPVIDQENDGEAVVKVFGDLDGTKRLSPGEIVRIEETAEFAHDCSTIAGSSGSPIVDFATAKVLGLHYGGNKRERNAAVNLAALANEHPLRKLLI
jgi:hypothetical protein